ncbi:MAG TPA: lysylphosphatidylglycerol synthase transmembrane domain-containing protein [Solirubrobacteraceae bacterium]|nr:lysylphosphatidylglycerol synthase transmembrane domain-containing protein [Solirubrobacteraceae bacterium]
MTSRRGVRPLLVAAGVVVTAASLVLAVRGVALDDAREALADSDLRWLLPASAVLGFALWLRVVRWWVLFEPSSRPPLRAVGHAAFVGYFFNNILPARAGEAARIIALHAKAGTPRAETIGTVVIERVFDLLALLVLLFASYPLLPEISWLKAAALFGVAVVLVAGTLVSVLVRYEERAVRRLLSPLRRLPGADVGERVEFAAVNATRGLLALRDPRVALRGMALTIASWAALGVSFWILTLAFDLGLPLVAGMLVVVAINLSLVLPSSPAALGVFEAATVVALRAFDVPQADALSYALVLHLLNFVPFIFIGLVLLGPGLRRGARAG